MKKKLVCKVLRNLSDNVDTYRNYKILNGWGMRSTKAIPFIFQINLSFFIINHPIMFYLN